jgi:hypothetical protein
LAILPAASPRLAALLMLYSGVVFVVSTPLALAYNRQCIACFAFAHPARLLACCRLEQGIYLIRHVAYHLDRLLAFAAACFACLHSPDSSKARSFLLYTKQMKQV